MARIRAIKPEFWSSPSLPPDPYARLLFIAMWNWADDNGIGTAVPRELLGFAFPNDDQITVEDLHRYLGEIHRCLGVEFYTVGGRPYFAIPTWETHQKFDKRFKGRHPGPEQAETRLYLQEHPLSEEPTDTPPTYRRDLPTGIRNKEQGNKEYIKDSSSLVADATERPEVEALLDEFDNAMNALGAKTPARNKTNRDAMRLLIDKDGYTPEQIKWIIGWATRDPFWRSNILSPKKLRDKFDQLKIKATAGSNHRPNAVDQARDIARQLRDMETLQTARNGLDLLEIGK